MDYEKYFVIFIKNSDSSTILIECEPEDKLIGLYNYSIEMSFEEFTLLGKSFKQCDDIDDIFILLKNMLNQTQKYNNGF